MTLLELMADGIVEDEVRSYIARNQDNPELRAELVDARNVLCRQVVAARDRDDIKEAGRLLDTYNTTMALFADSTREFGSLGRLFPAARSVRTILMDRAYTTMYAFDGSGGPLVTVIEHAKYAVEHLTTSPDSFAICIADILKERLADRMYDVDDVLADLPDDIVSRIAGGDTFMNTQGMMDAIADLLLRDDLTLEQKSGFIFGRQLFPMTASIRFVCDGQLGALMPRIDGTGAFTAGDILRMMFDGLLGQANHRPYCEAVVARFRRHNGQDGGLHNVVMPGSGGRTLSKWLDWRVRNAVIPAKDVACDILARLEGAEERSAFRQVARSAFKFLDSRMDHEYERISCETSTSYKARNTWAAFR